ncbi:MAG: hypothetical protein JW719_10940 [Pirellulales bacterium]|nr:hypothetical protein [Pirellulales bacterium]
MVSLPQYCLYTEASAGDQPGRWRFVLTSVNGLPTLEAEDVDPDARGERLELLSVVYGLEAIDQPAQVVLMTPSVYVREGIRYGLPQWRRNDWQWESFGKMVPVKNSDLWQRVQQALRYHEVECRTWRIDPAHASVPSPHMPFCSKNATSSGTDDASRSMAFGSRLRRLIDHSWPRIVLAGKELDRVACL